MRSTGSSITGVVHIIGSSCYDAGTNISVSGTLDNSSIQVTSASIDGQVFAFNGTAGGSGSSISGGYTITGGCAGGDSGNVSGTRIPSLSGTWSATLTSTPSSAVAHVTSASLTQSGPDAGGFFPLTGTATLLDSSCYTSASLSGWIIGRYVFIRATNSANSSEFTDVFTLVNTAGTSGTGDYEAFNGPCAGDFGTVSLSKQ